MILRSWAPKNHFLRDIGNQSTSRKQIHRRNPSALDFLSPELQNALHRTQNSFDIQYPGLCIFQSRGRKNRLLRDFHHEFVSQGSFDFRCRSDSDFFGDSGSVIFVVHKNHDVSWLRDAALRGPFGGCLLVKKYSLGGVYQSTKFPRNGGGRLLISIKSSRFCSIYL